MKTQNTLYMQNKEKNKMFCYVRNKRCNTITECGIQSEIFDEDSFFEENNDETRKGLY